MLNLFKKKMKEYQVTEYRAFATSAVREAENTDIVLDAIKRNTNLEVKVLSNSEQRYINLKGMVAKYEDFHQVVSKNTAFVDVGAGSVQISLFDKNNLIVTENIPIGAVRVRDYLSMMGSKSGRLDKIMSEYVENDIVTFRNIYLNDKEIKNVIAVAVGVSDGMGFGDNSRAALVARGLAEMTRLGVAMGARAETFAGLSGIGDLVVTCTSRHSRNHAVGERLGKGEAIESIVSGMNMVAEGVWNSHIVNAISESLDVEMPICSLVHQFCNEGVRPADAVNALMGRSFKKENY